MIALTKQQEKLTRFNRTFMELKYLYLIMVWTQKYCFNRTFMELKYWYECQKITKATVLIVPLWNWNTSPEVVDIQQVSFNRTFMELKYTAQIRLALRSRF